MENKIEKIKPKSPLDFFFQLGDKITKGDVQKQADFTYYMLWILFLAFFAMFFTNTFKFFVTFDVNHLIYAAIGFAIMSLQFFSLKSLYEGRKLMKESENQNKSSGEKEEIEDVNDMLKDFK